MKAPSTTASDFDSCRGATGPPPVQFFSSTQAPARPLGAGRPARPTRRLGAPTLLIVALAVVSALAATPASAAYLHPEPTYAFGEDGTSGSTFPGSERLTAIAFNQSGKRIYTINQESPTKLYGFNFAAPGSFSPVGGGVFPISVAAGDGFLSLGADSSPAGNVYYSDDGESAEGFSPEGGELADLVPNSGEKCGVAVDKEGHPWLANYNLRQIERFNASGGGPTATVDVSSQGAPCRIAFDQQNNDLYVAMYSPATSGQGIVRYTAASGYSPASAKTYSIESNRKFAVNGVRHVLYVLESYSTGIIAYDTVTGAKLEEFGPFGCYGGIAVEDATDTVFTTEYCQRKIQEWKGVIVPEVVTGDPVGNSKVSGSVALAGGGDVTQCKFEYWTTNESSAESQPCAPATPYSTDQSQVTAELPGLVNETAYSYRIFASNANGASKGATKTITPHNVNYLQTEPADEITRTTARLNGSFQGTNMDTHYYFEWGTEAGTYEHQTATPPGDDRGTTTGPTTVSTSISGLTAGSTYHYRVVAENGLGVSRGLDRVLTSSPAVKDLTTTAATEITPTGATLNGTLDPDGLDTTFYFQWGKDSLYGQAVPLPPGDPVGSAAPGAKAVGAKLEDLERGTTYHFRIVATNNTGVTTGLDQTFATPQPPSINSFSSTNVTATSADLIATINPNGYDTNYRFEYGTTAEYGSVAPVPDGELAASTASEGVTASIASLRGVTYHFRLIAENEWGETKTEDQTFDFNPPFSCPNHTLRQQTGAAYLPDCRGYELVSAGNAGGSALFPQGPVAPYASSPARFAYFGLLNAIPGSGEPQNSGISGDLYIASRTSGGWVTKYVGIPGYQSVGQSGPPGGEYNVGAESTEFVLPDRSMNRILVWDRAQSTFFRVGTLEGSYAPHVFDNEGHFLNRLPTNLAAVPDSEVDMSEGGFQGSVRITPTLSHYFFSSINTAFAEGGLTAPPGSAYDNDTGSGDVTIVSKTAAGNPIPRDSAGGVAEEFIRLPAVSDDGSHILMSTAAAGGTKHLYMRVDHLITYDVSADQAMVNQGVRFEGMTSDGSTVYFTTNKTLTADDTDTSRDLYMWSESTDSVTRISDSGNLPGNTDACSPASEWTSGCNVEVVAVTAQNEFGEKMKVDTSMSSDSGDIYFYSPELLDGARGFANKRNLYVYRDGAVHHVATLDPNSPAVRINVSPSGSHMAVITATRLTSYNNNSQREMYTYDPIARSLTCVSCLPSGAAPGANVQGSKNGLFMSDDGRAFFSTRDSLVSQDANGIVDVYEYVVGRPQLISSGTGDNPGKGGQAIGLIGVSADGTDAYFSTFETLVGQDENGAQLKFYDARTNGGFLFNEPPTPCVAADECHGADSAPPPSIEVGTAAGLGSGGNLKPPKRKPRRCGKKKRCQGKKAQSRHHRSRRNG
jgi:hypothetical protein